MKKRYVIVGGGVAGAQAALATRESDPAADVDLVVGEGHLPYARPLLTDYIAGRLGLDRLTLKPEGFWSGQGATLHLDCRVEGADLASGRIWLSDGRRLTYDGLCVATGARPEVPPVLAGCQAVTGLRDLDQACRIRQAVLAGGRIVVVGAGVLGIKLACALREAGASLAVVEALPRILAGVADAEAATLAQGRLARLGVAVRCGVTVARLSGSGGPVTVELSDGTVLEADLIVACTGIRPNLDLVLGQVRTERGVVVDEAMRTSAEGVWAAGDIVETPEVTAGRSGVTAIWPHAAAQGRVAGASMTGRKAAFRGCLRRNVVDVLGLPIASMGEIDPPAVSGWSSVSRRSRRGYLRVVLYGDVPVGAVVVGDLDLAGRLQACVRKRDAAGWTRLWELF